MRSVVSISQPLEVCYRVNIEGQSPDVIEQALSPVEALMIEACRGVICQSVSNIDPQSAS